jgi:hypothetical protein
MQETLQAIVNVRAKQLALGEIYLSAAWHAFASVYHHHA